MQPISTRYLFTPLIAHLAQPLLMPAFLQFTAVNNMPKWEINVTKTQDLTLLVTAASYEEARAIYESGEDIDDDYTCTNQEMRLDTIVKVAD